jgi:biopolymer transport protein ExbD
MRARRHLAESEHHGIDLAPMLDFVLNLLIFFIITTSFVKEAGVVVAQPEAQTAELKADANILIAVRENGEIWMERRQVDVRDIRSRIERMHVERPDDSVVIIADKASKAGVVAQVMDEVRMGGIKDVALGASASAEN